MAENGTLESPENKRLRTERTPYELSKGEQVEGVVVKLPVEPKPRRHGKAWTNYLILRDGETEFVLLASAKKGHVLLATLLREKRVRAGDLVTVEYKGKRTTEDGEREYHDYGVEIKARKTAKRMKAKQTMQRYNEAAA